MRLSACIIVTIAALALMDPAFISGEELLYDPESISEVIAAGSSTSVPLELTISGIGGSQTYLVWVINPSRDECLPFCEGTLPAGWISASPEIFFLSEQNYSRTTLLTLGVPEAASAGTYSCRLYSCAWCPTMGNPSFQGDGVLLEITVPPYCTPQTPAQGSFAPTGGMTTPRFEHTAALLGNGKVLVAGGLDNLGDVLASAELYDPAGGTFTSTGSMSTVRDSHTATLLNNGKVLIAGGSNASWPYGPLASAELYDPASGTFTTTTGSMTTPRSGHSAALLATGEVLLIGGQACSLPGCGLASAEIYDPAADTFTPTGGMSTDRYSPSATLLNNGKVLIAGGEMEGGTRLASAELYNPASGTFTPTGSMSTPRFQHTATILNTGKVLVAGGTNSSGTIASAELYNPLSGAFTQTGSMSLPRNGHTATLLNSGEVLVVGGDNGFVTIAGAELYDPECGTFTSTGSMNDPRVQHTTTLLNDGGVLVAGGVVSQNNTVLSSAELYQYSDLFISTLTVPVPYTTGPTGSLPITEATKNMGYGTTGSFTNKYYLAAGSCSGTQTYVGSRAIGALAAGATDGPVTTTVTLPGVATGTYYVVAVADDGDAVVESREDNNTRCASTSPITVANASIDLVINSVSTPLYAKKGSVLSVSDVTKNRLTGSTSTTFNTTVYVSNTCAVDSTGAPTGTVSTSNFRSIPGIAGSGSSAGSISLTMPSTPGSYCLIWRADSGQAVPEAAENNNTKTKTITISN